MVNLGMKVFQTQLLEAVTATSSDSRYPVKLHESLKEMLELGMKISILSYTLSKAIANNRTLSILD